MKAERDLAGAYRRSKTLELPLNERLRYNKKMKRREFSMVLHQLLGIPARSHCVAVCGSGGKSSLCRALSLEAKAAGFKSAVTVSTHIGIPAEKDFPLFVGENAEELRFLLQSNVIPVAGKHDGGKLAFGGEKQWKLLLNEADKIYVEADGSRMLPLKYPNATEPVLPVETDCVLVVCGLSALGKPAAEVCHRWELAQEKMPDMPAVVEEETVARLLLTGYGRFSPVYVLNQADTPELAAAGMRIKDLLFSGGADNAAVISLKNRKLADKRFF